MMAASVPMARQGPGLPDAPARVGGLPSVPDTGAELLHHGVPLAHWQQLAGQMVRWTGLAFPPARLREFERGVAAASASAGATSVAHYVAQLLAGPPSHETVTLLAQHLTVGETYFFRDPPAIQALANHVLPQLQAATPRGLRLWSAGCCTGEEVYTLAILLQRARLKGATVLGTDINPAFLARARMGVYGDWSFRGDPFALRGRWFSRAPEGWVVNDALRACVRFEADSLADDSASRADVVPAHDLIICRNVLMYLSPDAIARAVARFHRRLASGGWLLVSPGEASDALYPGFEAEVIDGVRFYRRSPVSARPLPIATVPATRPEAQPLGSPGTGLAEPGPNTHGGTDRPRDTPASGKDGPRVSTDPPVQGLADAQPQGLLLPRADASQRVPSPDPSTAHGVLARTLADQGHLAQARQCCEAWVAAEPLSAAARYVQALVFIEQDDLRQAADTLRRAIFLDDRFVMAWLALARLARAAGDESLARRHLGTARRLLGDLAADAPVPEADGLVASQVCELVAALDAPSDPEAGP